MLTGSGFALSVIGTPSGWTPYSAAEPRWTSGVGPATRSAWIRLSTKVVLISHSCSEVPDVRPAQLINASGRLAWMRTINSSTEARVRSNGTQLLLFGNGIRGGLRLTATIAGGVVARLIAS